MIYSKPCHENKNTAGKYGMKEKGYKDKAYMEVLRKLRQLIAAEYRDGGRLPPSREMCKRYNVCLPTYGKAIERLRIDDSVYKNSNKGIFVYPYSLRFHKVGLVIADGQESPFLEFQASLAYLMLELKKYNCHIQLIQSGTVENISRKAAFHGVNSLIWFINGATPSTVVREIQQENLFPLLLMNMKDPTTENTVELFRCNCVHYDYRHSGRKRAEILLSRNHKNIAYIGSEWFAEYTTFASAIRAAGAVLYNEQPLFTEKQIRDNLADVIRKNRITGLYSEGGRHNMQAVFEVISELPEKERPEVLVTYFEAVPYLLQQYPGIKCIGKCAHNAQDIPETTAHILRDYLENGTPLHSASLKSFVFLP